MAYETVHVEDSVFLKYKGYDPKGAAYAMAKSLAKFQDHDPRERSLILSPSQRQELENLLGTVETSPVDLLFKIANALRINVGGLEVTLRETQLRKLQMLAERTNRSVGDVLKESVQDALKAVLEA